MKSSEKVKRINQEKKKLREILKDVDEDKLASMEHLIDNAAFMSITLISLQNSINKEGTMIKYQNGENQHGYRQNPDITTFNSLIQRYTTIVQMLTDLLPQETKADQRLELLHGLQKPSA